MDEETILKKSRKRKPSTTPRMLAVSVRLPVEVVKWYRHRYSENYTGAMRGLLLDNFDEHLRKEPLPLLDTVKE